MAIFKKKTRTVVTPERAADVPFAPYVPVVYDHGTYSHVDTSTSSSDSGGSSDGGSSGGSCD